VIALAGARSRHLSRCSCTLEFEFQQGCGRGQQVLCSSLRATAGVQACAVRAARTSSGFCDGRSAHAHHVVARSQNTGGGVPTHIRRLRGIRIRCPGVRFTRSCSKDRSAKRHQHRSHSSATDSERLKIVVAGGENAASLRTPSRAIDAMRSPQRRVQPGTRRRPSLPYAAATCPSRQTSKACAW